MNRMRTLNLTLLADGRSSPLKFEVQRVINAGYVGRNRQAVQAHIEELSREGVPRPSSVPLVFPVLPYNLTTDSQIEVIGGATSGEVEYVLLIDGEEIFVGVGSDHTDRALERTSLTKSKQICKNVLSTNVWRYRDVKDRWDDLVIQSWVTAPGTDQEVLYQKESLRSILAAESLLDLVRSRMRDRSNNGLVLFSGTVPLLNGQTIYGDCFRAELFDPQSEKSLGCAYRVERLAYLEHQEE